MTLITRAPNTASSEVGSKCVVVSAQTSRAVVLNRVGGRLWSLLSRPTEESALCAALVERYGISEARAATDVRAFVRALAERKLITLQDERP